jgi:hypothetical protein
VRKALLVGLFLWPGSPAFAVLGQTLESVGSDQAKMRGEVRSLAGDGFSVQEITAPDGTVVREYVAPSGLVFAVSWQGMTRPDLAQLLGSYFQEFRESSRTDGRRRRPLVVRTSRLVVEMGGHVRAFRGRAYLPDFVPGAVAAEAIR